MFTVKQLGCAARNFIIYRQEIKWSDTYETIPLLQSDLSKYSI